MVAALISLSSCEARHISVNCVDGSTFSADPDVAGKGVTIVFIATSSAACIVALGYWFVRAWYDGLLCCGSSRGKREGTDDDPNRKSWFTPIENFLVGCSDQQLFVGLAWGIALRYSQGCNVSAYHYNIIANMLLVSIATHLVVVGVIRNFWESKFMAVARIAVMVAVVGFTGLLFAQENVAAQTPFPSHIPDNGVTDLTFTWPAVCFQSNATTLADMLVETAKNGTTAENMMLHSEVDGHEIANLRLYFLAIATFAIGIIRLIVFELLIHCCKRQSSRGPFEAPTGGKRLLMWIYSGAQFLMIVVGFAVVGLGSRHIIKLRSYMDKTGKLQDAETHENPENQIGSFGQLVPLLLISLTIFLFIKDFSETGHHKYKHHRKGYKKPEADVEQFSVETKYN